MISPIAVSSGGRLTKRVSESFLVRKNLFHHQGMRPAIPKIVFVAKTLAFAIDHLVQFEPGFVLSAQIAEFIILGI